MTDQAAMIITPEERAARFLTQSIGSSRATSATSGGRLLGLAERHVRAVCLDDLVVHGAHVHLFARGPAVPTSDEDARAFHRLLALRQATERQSGEGRLGVERRRRL